MEKQSGCETQLLFLGHYLIIALFLVEILSEATKSLPYSALMEEMLINTDVCSFLRNFALLTLLSL